MLRILLPLLLAVGLVALTRRRGAPSAVLVAALLAPTAWSAPDVADHELTLVRQARRLTPLALDRRAPRAVVLGRNMALIDAARRRIPLGAEYNLLRAPRPESLFLHLGDDDLTTVESRRLYYAAVWMHWKLAPRVEVERPAAWAIVLDGPPEAVGISGGARLRVGDDRLVRR